MCVCACCTTSWYLLVFIGIYLYLFVFISIYWYLLVFLVTLFIYFPAGMAQLRAVPASSPSEDQSLNMVATNIEVESFVTMPNKKNTRNDAGLNEDN